MIARAAPCAESQQHQRRPDQVELFLDTQRPSVQEQVAGGTGAEVVELGEGQEFRGEGILALTKALLQSGVGYAGGYQGAPISHLMDVLSDAQDLLGKLGVQFSASASEAAAAASLSASMMYPIRGAVTFKSTVGTNVASDALANLASSGVTGGALIIVGEDYGEGSSIMQERSHAFAMKSQMWLLDPRPDLPSIVKAVEDGFELSEASNTPVMLEVRVRSCHVHGSFIAKDNRRPAFTLRRVSWIAASVGPSRALVASSRISTRGLASSARAIPTRWRSPPESFRPRSPTMVDMPFGRPSMKGPSSAASAAARTSSVPAPGRAKAMLA